ncbi:MAG: LytTR family transcriptional regulator [Bacteroidales bacterium]|nr:LytTR family transcriptional regulator [Bacteroidales bacterium]
MSADQRISLNTLDTIHLVNLDDILYCKCDNSSTTFCLVNGKSIQVSRSIKEIESQLAGADFIRSHQSYLVNMRHIVAIRKAKSYSIVLSDNTQIPTSTRKRKEILQILTEK